eukprot:Partr_v1_DN27967_c1_g1_i4_m11886 putative Adaptor-related protein complex
MDKLQAAVNDLFKTKVFPIPKRGETFELKAELNADTREKRKEGVKKVIANMTIGKDVSPLFADVVKNMQTDDLELKKLVYLYLINYATSQPELVILAVNTFVKDSDDPNPLIRALAIRTMGCLRVSKMTDYICEPLRKALNDNHPYVRKTAVICVAKLFDLNPNLALDNGFVTMLQDLLSDPNPMVVANSVAALLEIRSSSRNTFSFNAAMLNKLSAALNDCTEWGQISILEALASHLPSETREADLIAERVLPRLQHINSAVVLSAVKVLIIYLAHCSQENVEQYLKKLNPPLVSLLSTPPEVQYVALRNIHLILQKYPQVLQSEIRVFFCKYNDPLYVKLEKLQLMVKLASDKNIEQVISELKEYAKEVDIEFVRKSVIALGECAVALESCAERCVNALLDLIKEKISHVVNESAVIVIKDVFRKYPHRNESVIPLLCDNLDILTEPDAKAAMIWIIGENAHRIENATELLEFFLEHFKTDTVQVQLQLLTATVKLFLKKPNKGQDLVQKLLQSTTANGESADLRDKAYIYWRLLSSDPQAAKAVVLAEKPPIRESKALVGIIDELIKNIGTIASVYHKPAHTFLNNESSAKRPSIAKDDKSDDEMETAAVGDDNDTSMPADLLDLDFGGPAPAMTISPQSQHAPFDLLSGSPPKPQGQVVVAANPFAQGDNVFDSAFCFPPQPFLTAAQAKGFELTGTFSRRNGQPSMDLAFSNKSMTPLAEFAIQFNKNTFGLIPTVQPPNVRLAPGQTVNFSISLATNGPVAKMTP